MGTMVETIWIAVAVWLGLSALTVLGLWAWRCRHASPDDESRDALDALRAQMCDDRATREMMVEEAIRASWHDYDRYRTEGILPGMEEEAR